MSQTIAGNGLDRTEAQGTAQMTQRRFLFYKQALMWPFQSGHDVHTFHMMKALTEAGHSIGLVTLQKSPLEPFARSPLALQESLEAVPEGAESQVRLRGLEERFRSYWGIPRASIQRLRDLARDFRADVVVVS